MVVGEGGGKGGGRGRTVEKVENTVVNKTLLFICVFQLFNDC